MWGRRLPIKKSMVQGCPPYSCCIRQFHDSQFTSVLWSTMLNNVSTVMQLYWDKLKAQVPHIIRT